MNEMIIKCTAISVIGIKNGVTWDLHSMKVQGVGVIVCELLNTVHRINKNISKSIMEINDMEELVINKHKGIKIIDIPNKKELKMAIYDHKNNLALGITFLSKQKINFTDMEKLRKKYTI